MNNATLALPKDRQEIVLIAQLHAYEEESVRCLGLSSGNGKDWRFTMHDEAYIVFESPIHTVAVATICVICCLNLVS